MEIPFFYHELYSIMSFHMKKQGAVPLKMKCVKKGT